MSTPTSNIVESLDQLSTTTTSRSSTPTEEKLSPKDEAKEVDNKALRVSQCPPHQVTRLHRTLTAIHGVLPLDQPFEHDVTFSDLDRRTLQPLTIRYVAPRGEGFILPDCYLQDQVTRAVWKRLGDLQLEKSQGEARPAVVFEEQPGPDGKDLFCIDLVFSTTESFIAARSNLDKIEVEHDGKVTTFAQQCWSNTLSGDILPLDILSFPAVEASLNTFFAAMQDMVSSIGQAIGAGLVNVGEGIEDYIPANITRLYIKLSPSSLRLKQLDLIDHLPTRLDWKGTMYTLLFPGRNLRDLHKVSHSYPGERASASSS